MADEPTATVAPSEPVATAPVPPVANLVADTAATAPAADADPAAVAKPEEAAKPAVPEAYEYTPPEGMEIKPEELTAFNDKAKELGLSQDQYKTLVDFALQREQANANAPVQMWNKLQTEWRGSILNDPALGDGKGLLPEAQQAIARVTQEFGGPELNKALEITGAGNNPEVVKFFVKLGRAMGDAGPLQFGRPAPQTQRGNSLDDIAARLYPSMQQGA